MLVYLRLGCFVSQEGGTKPPPVLGGTSANILFGGITRQTCTLHSRVFVDRLNAESAHNAVRCGFFSPWDDNRRRAGAFLGFDTPVRLTSGTETQEH